jgi:hypothetical protein
LATPSQGLGQTTIQGAQKKITEEKSKEPEVRKRGRPRKVNRQEEGRERDGNGGATETKGGRGRPRKQSHDLIIKEFAPGNQRGGDRKEEERRRSSRKRKLKLADGTTSVATISTNENTGSDEQDRQMVGVATQSVRPTSEKPSTDVRANNLLSSSSSANPIPTKTEGSDITSSHSIAAGTSRDSTGETASEEGEKSMAEGSTSTEEVIEPENAKIDDQNVVPPMDGNMDSQIEGDATSEDSEDPLCGLKSKRRREREEEGEKDEDGEQGEGGMEKRSRMEEEPELEGGDEGKGQPASPELITSGTEVDQGEMIMDSETQDSNNTSENKKDESNSDSTGTRHAQISDSKSLTAASESQSAEQSKVPTTSESTTKSDDKTTSSTRESNGGRKCLSLRRHSTGPSTMSSGDGVSGEGGERGEVGEEREETAVGGLKKKPPTSSLGDTPTNGKGGILKHISQFDTPSTAKVSLVE